MKVNCPYHEDVTASMEIYSDEHYYCYGCRKHGDVKNLPTDIVQFVKKTGFKNFYREDVATSLIRIKSLPTKIIRGLELPYDDTGYYIVYPDTKYYVKRVWDDNDPNRYRAPKGTTRPIWCSGGPKENSALVITEGEINAYSAIRSSATDPEMWFIRFASPGSAGDMIRPKTVNYCLQFDNIIIIVDYDQAGVAAGLQLKNKLIEAGKRAVLYPVEKDFNELLCESGAEAVKAEIKRAFEML